MKFHEVPPSVPSVPFTDPAEATFPAYRVFVYGPHVLPDQKGQVMSLALMRAVLINATRDTGGSMAKDDLTGALTYRYPELSDVFVAHPDPDPGKPLCSACGQWDSEHANPNGTACAFHVRLSPVDNPECFNCDQPLHHHGRRYTVACDDYAHADERVIAYGRNNAFPVRRS